MGRSQRLIREGGVSLQVEAPRYGVPFSFLTSLDKCHKSGRMGVLILLLLLGAAASGTPCFLSGMNSKYTELRTDLVRGDFNVRRPFFISSRPIFLPVEKENYVLVAAAAVPTDIKVSRVHLPIFLSFGIGTPNRSSLSLSSSFLSPTRHFAPAGRHPKDFCPLCPTREATIESIKVPPLPPPPPSRSI